MSDAAFAVLGDPIEHSMSPAMHEAAFVAQGLPHRYERWRVSSAQLGAALDRAYEAGMLGLNLTVPLKVEALPMLAELDAEASAVGAANTLRRGPTGWIGHNTDAAGFVRALESMGGPAPARAVVFGTGGAAKAVVHGLRRAYPELELRIVSRRAGPDPAVRDYATFLAEGPEADLWVNTTTVGMKGGPERFPVPLDPGVLSRDARVLDIVYPRPAQGLLAQAESAGLRVQDGREMLLWQGAIAQELWLDLPELPGTAIRAMRAALGL